jgi:hypothetical protein
MGISCVVCKTQKWPIPRVLGGIAQLYTRKGDWHRALTLFRSATLTTQVRPHPAFPMNLRCRREPPLFQPAVGRLRLGDGNHAVNTSAANGLVDPAPAHARPWDQDGANSGSTPVAVSSPRAHDAECPLLVAPAPAITNGSQIAGRDNARRAFSRLCQPSRIRRAAVRISAVVGSFPRPGKPSVAHSMFAQQTMP